MHGSCNGHHQPRLKVQWVLLGGCTPGHGLRDRTGLNLGMENPWAGGTGGCRAHKRSLARARPREGCG